MSEDKIVLVAIVVINVATVSMALYNAIKCARASHKLDALRTAKHPV